MEIIQCATCLLDSKDDRHITFDAQGVCKYCNAYKAIELDKQDFIKNRDSELKNLIQSIKDSSTGTYDCVIGLSGGTDSSYLAYLVKQWGLNPLVVHLDNGWNSALSIQNIKNVLEILNFELYTHVINWEEFKDLQRSYIKASVVDVEALTDHAIGTLLLQVANKFKIKYILSGESTFTEGLLPDSWIHNKSDLINIKAIHKKFGQHKIKTFPTMGFFKRKYYTNVKKITIVKPLDYIDYNKEAAQNVLKTELNWKDYGAKHNESVFTKFYQDYILPTKFGIDKRKSHLSTLIRAGQLTKAQALEELNQPIVSKEQVEKDKEYVLKKLGFTTEEFDQIMAQPRVEHEHYGSMMTYFKYGSRIKRSILGKK